MSSEEGPFNRQLIVLENACDVSSQFLLCTAFMWNVSMESCNLPAIANSFESESKSRKK